MDHPAIQVESLPELPASRAAASAPRLSLAPLPPGLLDRAMAQIRLEAAAGRARPVLADAALEPAGHAAPAGGFSGAVLARRRRRELLALVGTLGLGLLLSLGLAWLWLSQDPLQLAQQRLALRQLFFDFRLLAQAEPLWLLGGCALLAALGLGLAALDDQPAALRVVGRQV